MIQRLKFCPLVVFGLLNTLDGLDYNYGAYNFRNNERNGESKSNVFIIVASSSIRFRLIGLFEMAPILRLSKTEVKHLFTFSNGGT